MYFKIYYIILVTILLVSCKSIYSVKNIDYQFISLDSTYSENEVVNKIIAPYQKTLETTMNEVVCKTSTVLTKAKPESKLGNILADATFFEAQNYFGFKPDLAIVNYGGIRIPSLPQGEITLGKMFELMPFDNYINLIYVKGSVLKEVCDLIANNGGWPVSGLKFKIRNQKAEEISIQGKEINFNKVYKIAISDYLANGGDNMSMLKALKREKSDLLLRDAFIQYFKRFEIQAKFIDAEIEERIVVE